MSAARRLADGLDGLGKTGLCLLALGSALMALLWAGSGTGLALQVGRARPQARRSSSRQVRCSSASAARRSRSPGGRRSGRSTAEQRCPKPHRKTSGSVGSSAPVAAQPALPAGTLPSILGTPVGPTLEGPSAVAGSPEGALGSVGGSSSGESGGSSEGGTGTGSSSGESSSPGEPGGPAEGETGTGSSSGESSSPGESGGSTEGLTGTGSSGESSSSSGESGGSAEGASGASTGSSGSSEQKIPFRFFSSTSFWNTLVPADASLDPRSAELAGAFGAEAASEVQEDEAGKQGAWISIVTTTCSIPIYTVPADQPTVRVTLKGGQAAALQEAWDAVPLPPNAQPAAGTDGHLVVWQPSTNRLWEFWRLVHGTEGWYASWGGAMQKVWSNPGVYGPQAWSGAEPGWGRRRLRCRSPVV